MSGLELALGSIVLVFTSLAAWIAFIIKATVPNNRSVFITVWAIAWLMAMAALVQGTGSLWANIGVGFALFVASFCLFTVFIGGQKGGTGLFKVGSPLPELIAPNENDVSFDIASLAGKPILLKFFRGHW